MTARYFEDFRLGERFESQGKLISEAEIIEFARRFDPQPFHIDTESARKSPYKGLIASGFHTMALAFRTIWDTGVLSHCSQGSPGIDEVRWMRPVRPGDCLRTVAEVTSLRPSEKKPDRGIGQFRFAVTNQRDETVMTMTAIVILARRPA